MWVPAAVGICTQRGCYELQVVVNIPCGNTGSLYSPALLCSSKCQICSGGFTQQLFQLASAWCTRSISCCHSCARLHSCHGGTDPFPLQSSYSTPPAAPALHHCYLCYRTGTKAPLPPLQNCCSPGQPVSTTWLHSPIGSGSSSYYRSFSYSRILSRKQPKSSKRKKLPAPQTEIHSGVKKQLKQSSHLAEKRQVVTTWGAAISKTWKCEYIILKAQSSN